MPTAYCSLHHGWRHEMHSSLRESEDYSSFTSGIYRSRLKDSELRGNSTLDGFLLRQKKRDGLMQYRTKHSKSFATSRREFLDEPGWPAQPSNYQTRRQQNKDQYIGSSTRTSRSHTSYYAESPKTSEVKWQEIEKKSRQDQKEFLDKYFKEGKFKDVPVSSTNRNVRRGDHLFYQGASGGLYNHHLLCTKLDGDYIHTIEYTGPSFGLSASSRSIASSNPLAFGAIQEGKLTYQKLEEKKAKIRKWPKELQRYRKDVVISRALSRKDEQDYQAFTNNCEDYVNWSICGLSTSLQVESWYQPAWDTAKAAGSAALQGLKRHGVSVGVPAFLKAVGNVSDEIIGAISSPLSPVGFAVGGVIETGYAAWSIYNDYKRMKEGRLSERQFKINTVSTASKAVGHIGGGITGSVIGSVMGPVGSVVGGAIGYGVCHVVGSAVGWCYEHAPEIKRAFQDYVIAPVKKVVNTCVDAVKTAGRKVWEGVKSVFSSLFSWW